MRHFIPSLVLGSALGLVHGAQAADSDQDEESADRAFHKTGAEGSISHPQVLADLKDVAKLCSAFERPVALDEENAFERGKKKKALKDAKKAAFHRIYQVEIGAKGFELLDYGVHKKVLPLRLDKPMVGFDGALSLSSIDKEGGRFELEAAVAEDVAKRHVNKTLALRVTFTLNDDRGGTPGGCYSYPKSDAFLLQVFPMSYELVASDSSASLGRARSERLERFRAWLDPGVASLRLELERSDGTYDQAQLQAALEAKRSDFQACVDVISKSAAATGMASFKVTVLPSGVFSNVERQLDSIREPEVVPCLERVLGSISVKKAKKPSHMQIVIAVDRAPANAEL